MVGRGKETELILKRLVLFLQGKWCVGAVTSGCGSEKIRAAEEEMKDWFAAAEQVRRRRNYGRETLWSWIIADGLVVTVTGVILL